MRLLFLSMFYPLPANNGAKMRTWGVMRALAAEGHEITLATFAHPARVNGYSVELLGVCRRVECVPQVLKSLSSSSGHIGRVRGVFSLLPYSALQARSEQMKQCILSLVRSNRFDAVVCQETDPLVNLPHSVSIPVILDNQNVEHVLLQRYLSFERNPARKCYAWLECRKTLRWQRDACRRSAIALACSEHDRTLIQSFAPKVPVMVVPNIIDVDTYIAVPPRDNTTVLYVGGMDWYPNRNAVEFFVEDILPEVRRIVPGIKFAVAFSPDHAAPEGFREQHAGIRGVEFVETKDVRAEVANAAVFVVPIRIGSGTRFKILEAGAMAKPIVSTRVGAEGLEFRDREEILLEDDPRTFAHAVAGLLADSYRRTALGERARRRVEQQYNFEVLRATLSGALTRLHGQAKSSPGPVPQGIALK